MKIISLKTFVAEQFSNKYKDLLDLMLPVLNLNFSSISQALNKNLDFTNNFNAQVSEISVTAPVNPANPVFIKNNMNGQCVRVYIDNLTDGRGNTAIPTAAPFVSFQNDKNQIKILNITGLTSGTNYTIRLTFFAQ